MIIMNSVDKGRVFPLPQYSVGDSGTAAVEMGRERNASSAEEAESRRVLQKWKGRSIEVHGHSQILRIRAEDSRLGEDIGEGNLSLKEKFGVPQCMVFSRPILPASPLRGKTSC